MTRRVCAPRLYNPMAPNITHPPTETSPLIAPTENHIRTASSQNGIATEPADPRVENEGDGGDIERQVSNGDTMKHVGLPEVKKRMKYIFPALAIGVSIQTILRRNLTNDD